MKDVISTICELTVFYWRISPGKDSWRVTSCFLMLLNSAVRLGALFALIVTIRYAWHFDLSRIPF